MAKRCIPKIQGVRKGEYVTGDFLIGLKTAVLMVLEEEGFLSAYQVKQACNALKESNF